MMPILPGWPGPAFSGRQSLVPFPQLPGLPVSPGQPQAPWTAGQAPGMGPAPRPGPAPQAADNPIMRMAAYGVPLVQGPDGQISLRAGLAGSGLSAPPNVAGMPQIPPPPPGMLEGPGSGLFRTIPPVAPFNPGRVVPQQGAMGPVQMGAGWPGM